MKLLWATISCQYTDAYVVWTGGLLLAYWLRHPLGIRAASKIGLKTAPMLRPWNGEGVFSYAISKLWIPEKFPYTYNWNDRAISVFEQWPFFYRTLTPDAAFQPIAMARVLYVYTIQQSVSAALPSSQAVAICPTGMKMKNSVSFLVKNTT